MISRLTNRVLGTSLIFALGLCPTGSQAVNLNYDRLSSLEEPLATHIGDTTLVVQGLIDLPAIFDLEGDQDTETNILANIQVTAETQLSNSLTLGASYFGSADNDAVDSYTDNVAVFVGGVWGTLALGNVTGTVREETRRNRGAGNAFLAYDDFLGRLSEDGLAYAGRFGPSRLSLNVDDDGNGEVGWQIQRPIGNKDYRFSVRLNDGEYLSTEGFSFDTQGASAMIELTYGSTVVDLGLGFEDLEGESVKLDRWFVSTGVAHKVGRWSFSAEAHHGEIEGQDESSFAIGMIYDIARGLSLNAGINDRDSIIQHQGISIRNEKRQEGIVSIRYSF